MDTLISKMNDISIVETDKDTYLQDCSTQIYVFKEYKGHIPSLPFPVKINREMDVGVHNTDEISKTNVKVFERNLQKREIISKIFTEANSLFILY